MKQENNEPGVGVEEFVERSWKVFGEAIAVDHKIVVKESAIGFQKCDLIAHSFDDMRMTVANLREIEICKINTSKH